VGDNGITMILQLKYLAPILLDMIEAGFSPSNY